MDGRYGILVSFACSVVVAWVAHRRIREVRSRWWLALVTVASVAVPIASLAVAAEVDLALGTPAYGCTWAGMRVEKCLGRDWSFLQDRLEHLTIEGEMDVNSCQAFVGGILPEPRDPKGRNGWINCADDDPTVWTPAGCGA